MKIIFLSKIVLRHHEVKVHASLYCIFNVLTFNCDIFKMRNKCEVHLSKGYTVATVQYNIDR